MDRDIYAMAAQMAAGALAGGVVATPGDAVAFAAECYDLIKEPEARLEREASRESFQETMKHFS